MTEQENPKVSGELAINSISIGRKYGDLPVGKKPCRSTVMRTGNERLAVWLKAKTTPWVGEIESSTDQRSKSQDHSSKYMFVCFIETSA